MLQQSLSAYLISTVWLQCQPCCGSASGDSGACMPAHLGLTSALNSCIPATAVIQPVAGWKSFEEPAEQPASSQLVQRQSTGGDIWGSLPVSAGAEEGVGPAGSSKQQAGTPREAGEAHSLNPTQILPTAFHVAL